MPLDIVIKHRILLIELSRHHEVLDAYIEIFHDLGYEVVVCSSIVNRQYINTHKYSNWIHPNNYKSVNKLDFYFCLIITYNHSIDLYLKELTCPIGLVVHNANYLFNINPSTTLKGKIHRISEKLTGKSRQRDNFLKKINFVVARSTSMKMHVQSLTNIPVLCIPDIYINVNEAPAKSDQQTIITHIGRIDKNLKNTKYLQKAIHYIQNNPEKFSLNIIGNSQPHNITPGKSIKVYNDYISSNLFSKIITESDYVLFLPNEEIRVKGSVEKVGYSHIPGSFHDAARHIRYILTPYWFPKDDLIKDLIIPFEDFKDIIQIISEKNIENKKINQEYFKQRIDHSLRKADKILSNIISDQ